VVDKPTRNLRVYDRDGKFLAFYPASIGSEEKPAPSGAFKVRRVDWNPDYVYDPRFAWKEVKTKRKLIVAAGPNNPIGFVWIDLTDPSYLIHGTPSRADIGKTESHGCIHLTNWNASTSPAWRAPGRWSDSRMRIRRLRRSPFRSAKQGDPREQTSLNAPPTPQAGEGRVGFRPDRAKACEAPFWQNSCESCN
jgi:hypothetical protein